MAASKTGKSGCGVVIKGVDKGRWVTISKIAILLKVDKAMATEIAGVCVLTALSYDLDVPCPLHWGLLLFSSL